MSHSYKSGQKSGKPICYGCNRPFDRSSPGATLTMGPTCAKRAASSGHLDSDEHLQQFLFFSEASDLGWLETEPKKSVTPRGKGQCLPKFLRDQKVEAKIAFDELMREFSCPLKIFYGNEAFVRYQDLITLNAEDYSLNDPTLSWLEPEHVLHLLFERQSGRTYYWRVLNESYTLLEIDPNRTQAARTNIKTIIYFVRALAEHRRDESGRQMTLPEMER